jgi:hypothetical protein
MNEKSSKDEEHNAVPQLTTDQEEGKSFNAERARHILAAAQYFMVDADALEEVLALSKPVIRAKQEEHHQELAQLLSEVKSSNEKVQVDVSALHKLTGLAAKLNRGGFLFRGHLLVALVSRFDAFIGAVGRKLLVAFPERLGKRSLTYADAAAFKSLEELRDKFIGKEIDAKMRESHNEQIRFLSSLANVQLGSDEPELLSRFIEITERRNCHIHSNGKASAQYLRVCSEHKVKFKERPEIGKTLNVTTSYFGYARKILSELAFKLTQTIVRKLFPEYQGMAEFHVTMIGIQLLKEERWGEALVFFDYASGLLDKWAGDESTQRNNIVNKAQALIGLGKRDEAMKVVQSVDWSASHPKYLLAIHILKNEYKEAAALMPLAGLNEQQYRDWPLFSKFHATEEFKAGFADLFGHQFGATIEAVSEAIAVIEEHKIPSAVTEQESSQLNQDISPASP